MVVEEFHTSAVHIQRRNKGQSENTHFHGHHREVKQAGFEDPLEGRLEHNRHLPRLSHHSPLEQLDADQDEDVDDVGGKEADDAAVVGLALLDGIRIGVAADVDPVGVESGHHHVRQLGEQVGQTDCQVDENNPEIVVGEPRILVNKHEQVLDHGDQAHQGHVVIHDDVPRRDHDRTQGKVVHRADEGKVEFGEQTDIDVGNDAV